MYDTRFACIVLLRPNIENAAVLEESNEYISVSLMAEPVNTAVFDPYKSSGLRPASMTASIDLSMKILVIASITSASLGCALKNVASNLSTFFNFPVPDAAPSSPKREITEVNNNCDYHCGVRLIVFYLVPISSNRS